MQPVLNVDDIKRVEVGLTRVGVSMSELMHRAGTAVADEVTALGLGGAVVVLCGLGNNGGDGWVAAETLLGRGTDVTVVSPADPDRLNSDLARVVAQSAVGAGVPYVAGPGREELSSLLDGASVVVDAILGTGFHGEPRKPFDIWIECINSCDAYVLAVDVPSGLSAASGLASGDFVVADSTITMLALKPGLLADEGRDACGDIVVAPLAEQTERLVLDSDPAAWRMELGDYLPALMPPSSAVDKFARGSVLVVGGSARYVGAPVMAAKAAARAGAGYVTLAVPDAIAARVQAHVLEIPVVGLPSTREGRFSAEAIPTVLSLAQRMGATLVGPGMTVSSDTVNLVSSLLGSSAPLVIDADGLNCLARLTSNRLDDYPEAIRRDAPLVLTPHRKELGRLVGMVDKDAPASLADQLEQARRIVWSDGGSELVVVAKGSATACVGVEGALLPKPGPMALATAGSGDVLGGIVASLMAQAGGTSEGLLQLCAFACELHGYAGAIAAERWGSRGVMATDVIDCVGLAADVLDEQVRSDGGDDEDIEG